MAEHLRSDADPAPSPEYRAVLPGVSARRLRRVAIALGVVTAALVLADIVLVVPAWAAGTAYLTRIVANVWVVSFIVGVIVWVCSRVRAGRELANDYATLDSIRFRGLVDVVDPADGRILRSAGATLVRSDPRFSRDTTGRRATRVGLQLRVASLVFFAAAIGSRILHGRSDRVVPSLIGFGVTLAVLVVGTALVVIAVRARLRRALGEMRRRQNADRGITAVLLDGLSMAELERFGRTGARAGRAALLLFDRDGLTAWSVRDLANPFARVPWDRIASVGEGTAPRQGMIVLRSPTRGGGTVEIGVVDPRAGAVATSRAALARFVAEAEEAWNDLRDEHPTG